MKVKSHGRKSDMKHVSKTKQTKVRTQGQRVKQRAHSPQPTINTRGNARGDRPNTGLYAPKTQFPVTMHGKKMRMSGGKGKLPVSSTDKKRKKLSKAADNVFGA